MLDDTAPTTTESRADFPKRLQRTVPRVVGRPLLRTRLVFWQRRVWQRSLLNAIAADDLFGGRHVCPRSCR